MSADPVPAPASSASIPAVFVMNTTSPRPVAPSWRVKSREAAKAATARPTNSAAEVPELRTTEGRPGGGSAA